MYGLNLSIFRNNSAHMNFKPDYFYIVELFLLAILIDLYFNFDWTAKVETSSFIYIMQQF